MKEDELKGFFDKHGIKAAINHYSALQRTIYYATIGKTICLPFYLYMVRRHR